MAVAGLEIQRKANSLFSAFFSKQVISTEVIKYQDGTDDNSVALIMSILRADAEKLKIPFKLYATQFVIQGVNALIGKHFDLKGNFFYAITTKLAGQGEIHSQKIQDVVNNQPAVTPFQVIVKLEKIGVVSIILYFQSCSECSEKLSAWVDSLFALACSPPNPEESDLLHYLLTIIIHIGFGDLSADLQRNISGQTIKIAVSLLNDLTRRMWDFLWEFPGKEIHAFDFLVDSQQVMFCQPTSLRRCYLEQLSFIISYKPEIKPITAIKSQHEWTFFKSPKNVANLITQLLIPLEVENVLKKIDEILNRYEINWKNLLLIISAVQVCYPTGNQHLKTLINSLMQRALENLQMELLLASFLLARQINAEHTSSPHYGTWFSSITSSSTTPKQFAFLLKFLSNIVRHEPSWILYAHRSNPPFIPMMENCRVLWTDYAALVRTRLEDLRLKQTDQIIEEDATVVKEVATAIAAFEKSGRISNAVIEAAIFRKPYFINKFLPILLKPRRVPNPPDALEELVEELKKSGKLPGPHYEAYRAACQQLQKEIPENEPMDWQMSDEKPNYEILMNHVIRCKDERQQSLLIEQLDGILGSLLSHTDSSTTVIDFNPNADEVATRNGVAYKIAKHWIQSIQTSCFAPSEPDWMNRYFLLFCRYPKFVESLYLHTREFIHNCTEDNDMARCYGIVILLLCRNSHIVLPVHYRSFNGTFVELLMREDQLILDRKESIGFYLRLLYYTVMAAKLRKELANVRVASSLYIWLCRRIMHSSKISEFQKFLGLSKDMELLKEAELPARTWLRLEMAVVADKDVLSWSERSGYLHFVLKTEYQDVPATELSLLILDAIMKSILHNPVAHADCAKDLLLLLQYLLFNEQPSSESPAWLIDYWLQLRHEQGKDVDQLMWSIVCTLPPYLLSRSSLHQPIQDTSLKALASLIENEWRNTVTSGSAWLPKYIASHLLRALEGAFADIPCLRFSTQVHRIHDNKFVTDAWASLDKALDVFHPLTYDLDNDETINWSGVAEVDFLASQMMTLVAVSWCTKGDTDKWPGFIERICPKISSNPGLLNAWKMPYWTGEDSKLPWMQILPTCMLNLLPFVILRVLISWSDILLPTTPDYLDALVTAHNQWTQVTHSFIDAVMGHENQSNYPVGQILDFRTLGRMASDVEQILVRAPIRSLKLLQQYSCFRAMEADYQVLVRKRCS
ncbi:uncharacterized protein LOC130703609 [Daphnia carinata]|uniref:uncharacterized protein LOC130703609 n=1 Tax=Daphnia carinata TaxID=120202 RepID=UPI00257CEE69|nr:uncharacterized protein LOC130703609 [Daphnia carinata]